MSEDRAEQEVVRILKQLAEAMSRTGPMDIELDNGEKVRVMLAEPHGAVRKYGKWLAPGECECGELAEFLCYPDVGVCCCGVHDAHVHCKRCGNIMQVE